ncbi:hypothetical protein WG908_02365 [Sphingobium sp. AN641]|uniref:hypothetical protein n=1 Tax=Sphingobium sp. AN641 TaxID=3133443 RepID=UPI0030BFFB87
MRHIIRAGWLALAAGLLLPGAARAEWHQVKAPHFTVYGDVSADQLETFATKLEKFDFLLRTVTKTPDEKVGNPVRVFLLSSDAKVKALARNRNIDGFYRTNDRFGYAVLSRERKAHRFDVGAEDILFHEYTHHFMLHYFPAAYPAWYVEGFAEFFSVITFPKDGSIIFGNVPMARAPTLVTLSIFPLAELFARETDGLSLEQGDRYYGTAWLVTHYFEYNDKRGAEFQRYLKDMVSGVSGVTVDGYFEGGTAALEKELRAYMKARMMVSTFKPTQMPAVDVAASAVEPARAALMEDELRLYAGVPRDERPALVQSIRATAAKFPASAHAAAILAEAEWLIEDKAAALVAADRAVALDAASSDAQATRAEILLDRAHDSDKPEDWKAALTAIVRANRADTANPVPLALYYRYHAMKGGPMPALGYDGLNGALQLLPQNPTYRFNLATALATKGDYATASRLLDPIAFSPHASDMREAAIRMKAEYDAVAKGK